MKLNIKFVILFLISIVLLIFICYSINNHYSLALPDPKMEEYPVSSSEYIRKEKEVLEGIASNYDGDIDVLGNTLVVSYGNNKYEFYIKDNVLSIDVDYNDNEFIDVFKLVFSANQKRLGNDKNLDNYFSNYLKVGVITKEMIVIKNSDNLEYIINVDKKIEEV